MPHSPLRVEPIDKSRLLRFACVAEGNRDRWLRDFLSLGFSSNGAGDEYLVIGFEDAEFCDCSGL